MSETNSANIIPSTSPGQISRIESKPFISQSLADFGEPGVWVEVDPETAEAMGAFEETAVSAADVEEADNGD
jgi:hypothetical protein